MADAESGPGNEANRPNPVKRRHNEDTSIFDKQRMVDRALELKAIYDKNVEEAKKNGKLEPEYREKSRTWVTPQVKGVRIHNCHIFFIALYGGGKYAKIYIEGGKFFYFESIWEDGGGKFQMEKFHES